MKYDVYKLTKTGEQYLGYQTRNDTPKKGDNICFLNHSYEVVEAREYIMFIKPVN